uniref:Uncharacterized protein n=1 Tax=Ascaris lumbricoides TaxID=6252 RepID=A0A0M3HKT1_ASCLU
MPDASIGDSSFAFKQNCLITFAPTIRCTAVL